MRCCSVLFRLPDPFGSCFRLYRKVIARFPLPISLVTASRQSLASLSLGLRVPLYVDISLGLIYIPQIGSLRNGGVLPRIFLFPVPWVLVRISFFIQCCESVLAPIGDFFACSFALRTDRCSFFFRVILRSTRNYQVRFVSCRTGISDLPFWSALTSCVKLRISSLINA